MGRVARRTPTPIPRYARDDGGTVDATTNVAGNIIVSPALNVDFNVQLWGRGKVLGSYTVPAGQTSADGIPANELGAAMDRIAKRPNA